MAMALTFDTLLFSNQLVEAGMPKKQADKIAEAQKGAFETQEQIIQEKLDKAMATHVATKEDLWELRSELRGDISKLDKKIDVFYQKLDSKIDVFQEKVDGKFVLVYWMFGSIFAMFGSIALKIFF